MKWRTVKVIILNGETKPRSGGSHPHVDGV